MLRFSFLISEDFNKRVFVPELTKDEEESLVKEVCQTANSLEFRQETTERTVGDSEDTPREGSVSSVSRASRVFLIFLQNWKLLVV